MNSAATPHNLKKGFIANGMIDIGSETCPDIDVMLGTLTRELTEHEYDLVQNNFNELLHIQMREGHISDEVYDRIGFPNDVNHQGQVVNKAGSLLKNSRDLQSKFYASYPSAAVIDKVDEPLGVFESLTMYCGIGFEMGNSNSTDKICQEKGGYLHWSKEILDYLSKKRSLNAAQLKTVKVEMVSYLFELCYDLCLGKQDNISSSPGFEKFLGQFGRGRDC